MHPEAKIPFKKRFTSRVSVMTDSAKEELEDFGCLELVKVAVSYKFMHHTCSNMDRQITLKVTIVYFLSFFLSQKTFSMALTCCSDNPMSSQMSSQSLLKDFGKVASIYWVNYGPLKASCLSNAISSNRVYNTRTDNDDAYFLWKIPNAEKSEDNFRGDQMKTLPSVLPRRKRLRENDSIPSKRCRRH
ncbi:hypothetical protein HOLleu_07780 [Holothuria leucospilota]|uniref:Uncharacterized protein n=1 Tax=Holothuria leucospilota TaxID=206669 RepID=A0A9Q1HFU9_HOLLE|nr:hypothetical protein HOLleu_07780 [Holothuria leucospilota]